MPAFVQTPAPHPLPSATRLGRVRLAVASLEAQVGFYTQVIGLDLLERSETGASLGAGGRELLRLTLKPGAKPYEHRTGLYHLCLAVPERADFARLLKRVLGSGLPLQGLVDHHVAEAIYLADAEGNGVELNWDRPRDRWPESMTAMMRQGNGPLDMEGLLALVDSAGPGDGRLPKDAWVGHLHLHVASLAESRRFYHEILGLDLTGEFRGQAVFTSAGGYHHHVAFNVWNGVGAPEPPADATGLISFELVLPQAADVQAVVARALAAGLQASPEDGGQALKDPSGNKVILRA